MGERRVFPTSYSSPSSALRPSSNSSSSCFPSSSRSQSLATLSMSGVWGASVARRGSALSHISVVKMLDVRR